MHLRHSRPLLLLFSWTPSAPPTRVWIPSFICTRSGGRRASPESVCVQPLLHQCVLITLHELVHARPAIRDILFQNVPTPLFWRSDNCFWCRHHHCRYWWWPHFRLFPNEHPRNSSAKSNEIVVPLPFCGFPLNSRASQQSTF